MSSMIAAEADGEPSTIPVKPIPVPSPGCAQQEVVMAPPGFLLKPLVGDCQALSLDPRDCLSPARAVMV
jgi:hypothetical protein